MMTWNQYHWSLLMSTVVFVSGLQEQQQINFKREYIQDTKFAKNFAFKDVTDVAINSPLRQVLVLQRSVPPVTVWDSNGTLITSWTTQELGYPHSITLEGLDPDTAKVWITDMAGSSTRDPIGSYGHCVKLFSYYGKYIRSIGHCGKYSNGSSLDPIQFDKVTDLAWNSNSGLYYIADGDLAGLNNRVLVLDPTFKLINTWNIKNQPGSDPLQFNLPHKIRIDNCNRVWITDSLNKRIQVISGEGIFLGEMNCFGNRLVYGLDFVGTEDKAAVLLTTKSVEDNHANLISVPVKMDCSNLKDFGECKMERIFILNSSGVDNHSMLHSVTVDNLSGDIYLTKLPGKIPPLKFYPAADPPIRNLNQLICTQNPPQWPEDWNATVLLTPYVNDSLKTAEMIYRAQERALYVRLADHKQASETLTIDSKTYTIKRDGMGNTKCVESDSHKWKTPAPDWLNSHNCKCQGATKAGGGDGIQTVLWECPTYDFVDWFWYEKSTSKPWRIFLNNKTNPSRIPVLGQYTMINFASYGTDTKQLKDLLDICMSAPRHLEDSNSNMKLNYTVLPSFSFVKGFSYKGCSGNTQLRNWPYQFYLTATMFPVNNYDPMPTSVVYDWTRHSQHTTMYSPNDTTSAYLINNNTYIVEHVQKNDKCISHLTFGPPTPDWMFRNKCTCMGILSNNFLSPKPSTIIAVCPLQDDRVFWTWFSTYDNYYPVIFFETLSPPGEGTSLAFAEYHSFYHNNMLIDLQDFAVPNKCKT